MNLINRTEYDIHGIIARAAEPYLLDGLTVDIRYCPKGSRRYVSGTYYRRARGFEDGKLIRVRVNRNNRYPLDVPFKTSDYFRKRDARGREQIFQKLITVRMSSAEELIAAIFLHEFSHYLDHMEGRNGRYKQTKADKFALSRLHDLGIHPVADGSQ